MRRSHLCVATLLALATASTAEAQITTLYSTNFNAPTYTDGNLVTVATASDITTPGQDGWLNTSAGLTNQIQVSNTATNGIVTLTNTGQDVRHNFNGGTAVTSGSVFYDADINVTSAATGDYSLHFIAPNSTSLFYGRLFFKTGTAPNTFDMALGTSSGTPSTTTAYGADLPLNTTIHVLVRYDINPGTADDSGAIFVNPTTVDGSGDTVYMAAVNQGADVTASGIGGIALRQGTTGLAAGLTVDNYRAFLSPVPEPSSLALLGMAGGAVLVRRLRRKAV
jgi:hypothetical protein